MPSKAYWASDLIGGTTGCLDKIPGADLADKDIALVILSTGDVYEYWLDVDSAASESSPDIIAPDNNGGDKRWLLKTINNQDVTVASSPTFVTITTTGGRIRNTTRKINTDSPYTVLATDEVLFFDTDGGAIEADLPAGVEGTHYKLINCGSSGNDLTVDPNGSEQIYGQGAGVDMILADGDVLDIDYNATEGWW